MSVQIRPKTRDAIIEAGFLLLSADPAANLADIATLAGVGRATLHRHFANRDELIRTLALAALSEMDEAAEQAAKDAQSAEDALRQVLAALINLGDRHGFLAHLPTGTDPEIDAEIARQAAESRAMIRYAQMEGTIDPALPESWAERQFDAVIMTAWESIRAEETTPGQACALAWRSLKQGWSKEHDR